MISGAPPFALEWSNCATIPPTDLTSLGDIFEDTDWTSFILFDSFGLSLELPKAAPNAPLANPLAPSFNPLPKADTIPPPA